MVCIFVHMYGILLRSASNEKQDLVTPLKEIYRIHCYKINKSIATYFVEGVATANEAKIKEHLPWVFNGWSLPRPIEVDKGLDGWSICGIQVTWNTANDQVLDICWISEVRKSPDGNTEFDLCVGLWVEREVLEKMAPSLLASRCFHNI